MICVRGLVIFMCMHSSETVFLDAGVNQTRGKDKNQPIQRALSVKIMLDCKGI